MLGKTSATWPDRKLALAAPILVVLGACAPTVPVDSPSALLPSAPLEAQARTPEEPGRAIDADPSAGDSGAAGAEIATAGRVVYLDPATGRLTPEPPEGIDAIAVPRELLDSIGSFHDNLEVTTLEDGTIVATRPGGFKTALMAVVGPNGAVTTRHVAPAAPTGEEVDHER